MAARHATAPARVGACRAVAFGGVGGSGLIVVVIVAAWALFLVPQWMHRRATAAAHLADRIPQSEVAGDAESEGEQTQVSDSRTSRRFGRRHLVRTPSTQDTRTGRLARLRLPRLPRPRGRASSSSPVPVSAAARRRRILVVLAISTLLSAVVVGVGVLVGVSVPGWVVAVPGGLMIAYLALLAIARPGAPRSVPAAQAQEDVEQDVARLDPAEAPDGAYVDDAKALEPAPAHGTAALEADESMDAVADPSGEGTWTPVPLPTPTYVTAPRARRSVRTIDLSNPGSWTASTAPEPEPATVGAVETAEYEQYPIEHRRAVGD